MRETIDSVILPVAGKGTRLMPQTGVLPKPLFPLAGRNDRVTCVLHVILAQIHAAGIARVALIVSPGQAELIARYLDSLEPATRRSLPTDIATIEQPTARGFGDAVLCGRTFTEDRPFAVLLGDHLHVATEGQPCCLKQVTEAFSQTGGVAMVGVHEVGIDEVAKVGLVRGGSPTGRVYRCLDFVEKPDPATAQERFCTPGLVPGHFLGHCGIYIFSPDIFTYLEQDRRDKQNRSEEIELAAAQAKLLRDHPEKYHLYKIAGWAYDMGTPSGYRRTLVAFADMEVPRAMDKTMPTKTKRRRSAVPLKPKTAPTAAGQPTTMVEVSSPGRLCLFGEHSDWGAEYGLHPGYCLVVGTDQCIKAQIASSEQFRVQSLVPDDMGRPSGRIRQMSCPWDAEALLAAATDEEEFFRYCAGVAHEMLRCEHLPQGLDIRIVEMELPLKKGVSSSAAVCILVAKAFNQCYGLRMLPHELMDISYAGERLTGSQCGRMDQACIYGSTPVLLVFDRSKDVKIEPVFPKDDLFLFYVDLAGKKNTVTILRDLQDSYPKHKPLQEALGAGNEAIVRQAFGAIQDGQPQELGTLMVAAQKAFDKDVAVHCPGELGAPLLHEVLGHTAIRPHVYGGKGVGSQGDGTAQFVAKSADDREQAMKKIVAAFPQMRCFPLTIRGTGTR